MYSNSGNGDSRDVFGCQRLPETAAWCLMIGAWSAGVYSC